MTPNEFKEIREGLGLTQANVAKLVGYSVRAVQMWEAGDRKIHPLAAEKLRGLRDA